MSAFPPPPPVPASALLLKKSGVQIAKKPPRLPFAETSIVLNDCVGKSPTVTMRNLDSYKLYLPLDSEREKYNLPEGRIVFTNMQNIMYISGAYVGLRFTSEDMLFMADIAKKCEAAYVNVDSYFRTMPSSAKKIGVPPSCCPESDSLSKDSLSTDSTISEEDKAVLKEFAARSVEFTRVILSIQEFVKRKQAEYEAVRLLKGDGERIVVSKDPDGLSSSSKPKWLEILMNKYKAHSDATKEEGIEPKTKPDLFSVGKLCNFLSTVVSTGAQNSWGEEEQSALNELLCASTDNISIFGASDGAAAAEGGVQALRPTREQYYARRFFNFISVLSEMKSVPKGEKVLF